jgi:hypothetical protein
MILFGGANMRWPSLSATLEDVGIDNEVTFKPTNRLQKM